jgi:hypothetical protein
MTESTKSRGGKHIGIRRVVDGAAVLRAQRLLDMMYKPSEIAEELKIKKRGIYDVLIPLGLPHECDKKGHIWLHGLTVREWLETATRGPKHNLAANEMFCLRCFAPRAFDEGKLSRNGKFVTVSAICSECGAAIYKGIGKRTAVKLVQAGVLPEKELEVFDQ